MKPILCNYYITYRCNSKCSYCTIWKKPPTTKRCDCDINDVIENLPQLAKLGVRFIDFTGGEPLLHPQLPEMLHAAKKNRFVTSVTTNCILYPQLADKIANLVDLLHFSIDSLDANVHNKLRGSDSHKKVLESVKIAREIGEKPDLLFTVTDKNYRSISGLSQFAREHSLILLVNPVFNNGCQKSIKTEIIEYLNRYKNHPYVYINRALHRFILAGGNQRNQPRCRAVTSTVVISPDNRLLFPCFHNTKHSIKINGNLENQYRTFREHLKNIQGKYPFCQQCTVNCYFDPSFLYKLDAYFWLSLVSKFKYGFDKYVRS